MRLIDADELKQAMYMETMETDHEEDGMIKWDSGCWIRYNLFSKVLDKMPTIDPNMCEFDHFPTDPDTYACDSFKEKEEDKC